MRPAVTSGPFFVGWVVARGAVLGHMARRDSRALGATLQQNAWPIARRRADPAELAPRIPASRVASASHDASFRQCPTDSAGSVRSKNRANHRNASSQGSATQRAGRVSLSGEMLHAWERLPAYDGPLSDDLARDGCLTPGHGSRVGGAVVNDRENSPVAIARIPHPLTGG